MKCLLTTHVTDIQKQLPPILKNILIYILKHFTNETCEIDDIGQCDLREIISLVHTEKKDFPQMQNIP